MGCFKDTDLIRENTIAKKMWEDTNPKSNPNYYKIARTIDYWGFSKDVSIMKQVFNRYTEKYLERGENINATDLKKFQEGIKIFAKELRKPGASLSNKILKSLYIGKNYSEHNPITRGFWYDIINANEFRNNHTQSLTAAYNKMINKLKLSIIEFQGKDSFEMESGSYKASDLVSPGAISAKRSANELFRKLDEKEKQHIDMLLENKQIGAENDINILLGEDKGFLKNEGRVFQDFYNIAVDGNPNAVIESYKGQNKQRYINRLTDAASEWATIATEARRHLINGVENLKVIIREKYPYNDKYVDRMLEQYDGVIKHLKSYDIAKEDGGRKGEGYVPHYLLNIIGDNIEFREKFATSKGREQSRTIMEDFTNKLADINTRLSQRLKDKGATDYEYFSRNPMLYATKYIEDVISFNHSSHIDKTYVKGLKKLTQAVFKDPNRKESQAAEVYLKIFNEMRDTALNKETIQDEGMAGNISRTLTSLQFGSKLGFSTRGAIRNLGQKLWNWIFWGGKRWRGAIDAYKGDKAYEDAMRKELSRRGLLYSDISQVTEGAVNRADMLSYGVDMDSGYLTRRQIDGVVQRWAEKTAMSTSKMAEASSVFTRWAENSNRASTFKIAFHEAAQRLKKLEKYSNWGNDAKIRERLYRKAGDEASKMTSLLHFEYSKIGKPKILREGIGKILGQFQHYAFSLAELQWNMVKGAGRAIKAGQYTAPEVARIVRLASLYAMVDLISGYFNIGFSSYINNDTLDRAKNLVTFLTGDEEESKAAFYGKGIVGALGLVPVSDMVELHNMGAAAGYWNMLADEDSTVGWLLGFREKEKMSTEDFLWDATKFGSIQAHRLVNKTLPARNYNNALMSMIRAELGLFPGEMNIIGGTTGDLNRWFREETPFLDPIRSRRRRKRNPYLPSYRAGYRATYSLTEKERNRALQSLSSLGG